MYNEEQKLLYLDTIQNKSGAINAKRMFNRFQLKEAEKHTDIAEWAADEIYNAIEHMYIFDYDTIKQYLSTLYDYRLFIKRASAKYTNNRVMVITPKLDASNIDLTFAIRNALIRTPQDLKKEISHAIEIDQGHYTAAALCFVWLGIDIEIMPLIRDTSVDFENRSIVDRECNIDIRDIDYSIIDILRLYWQTTEAIRWHNSACKAYPIYNGRFLHIFAGANSEKDTGPIKPSNLKKSLSRVVSKLEEDGHNPQKIDRLNVRMAGGLYRLYQLEKSGVDVLSSKSDDILLKTYNGPGKAYDIRALYRQYKFAFDLD